ncbi:MAG: 16S rRNA (cytosine(1402)-N(4))-methyltransferase RsmH [Alphaproteobacteria bacterium]|nr:MAG: 16S rRNA (cytosine(1402)-N(4))-methyltransferase RsmH [Alphaproteobacteria bacterium]
MSPERKNRNSDTRAHIPVMLGEVLDALAPKDGGIYVDGTFGAGGYTGAILDAADCTVYAIDRDPEAYARAVAMATNYPGRLIPKHGCFGSVAEILQASGVTHIDGLVLDLGVSSIQLATPQRGFSFQSDGPLDMRMSAEGPSAKDVVNKASEAELADIIFTCGEERASRRIAKRIVEARREKPIETTKELAKIVHSVLPMHGGMKTDTATRTFQALRIYVNDELGELDRALAAAEQVLAPDGRLVVVSFHSLEDWRVKNFLKDRAGRTPNVSRHLPPSKDAAAASFSIERNSGVAPSGEEVSRNPRSRSARLRWAIRTSAPAMEGACAG